MKQNVWTLALTLGCFLIVNNLAEAKSLAKRETDQNAIDPVKEATVIDEQDRDKRSQQLYSDPKFGVKNAVIGFVFNKLNSFIDQKTLWIDQLDKTNIAKNRAHGIYPPTDPVVSLSGIITGKITQALQASAPLITVVTNKLSSGSNPSAGGHSGFKFGNLLSGISGGSSGFGGHTGASAEYSAGIGAGTGYGATAGAAYGPNAALSAQANLGGAHVGANVGAYGAY